MLTPKDYEQRRRVRQLLRREQAPDVVPAERAQFPQHRRLRARVHHLLPHRSPRLTALLHRTRLDLLERREREPRLLAVVLRDGVDDLDRLRVAAAAHEVLGRLVHVEDEEAEDEEEHHEPAHREEEVPPALVGLARAVGRRCAGEVGDEGPGDL